MDRVYVEPAGQVETALPRGDVTDGVARVGDTVRRPHQPQSPAVAAYLDHLESVGFEASPRYLGRSCPATSQVIHLRPGRLSWTCWHRWLTWCVD